ncbi:hypothetical protein D920_03125 [Enterococcus faecalis 13-SD-W-01]|nr:hypothetical protein D920_03125 [Enterococcus faecalis 13-SD-W-01]
MNKQEFITYIEENLEFSHLDFYNKAVEHYKSTGRYNTKECEQEAVKLWKEELSTFYAVARAEILNKDISWEDYLSEFEVLTQIERALEDTDFYYVQENEKRYKKYDERGHRITTMEGFTGYVAEDIKPYFYEMYLKQEWNVVPGHWPSMETKEDVDDWIESMTDMMEKLHEQIKKQKQKLEKKNKTI